MYEPTGDRTAHNAIRHFEMVRGFACGSLQRRKVKIGQDPAVKILELLP